MLIKGIIHQDNITFMHIIYTCTRHHIFELCEGKTDQVTEKIDIFIITMVEVKKLI